MNAGTIAPLSCLVAEDEPLARLHLRELITATPSLRLVGEAADGREGLRLLETLRPDVLFLDIRMPEMDGVAVLEHAARVADRVPYVVFTTAFDAHAVQAFELGAVDYLLKPFGAARFARAVERLVERVRERVGETASDGASVNRSVPEPLPEPLAEYLTVRERGALHPIPVADVLRLEADDDYVTVVARGGKHLLTSTLGQLLEQLDARRFVRVHRSHAVNLDHVRTVAPFDAGRVAVVMHDGSRVITSRSGTRRLRQAMSGIKNS